MTTDTTYGDALPISLRLPDKSGTDQTNGKAGNCFISGGKIMFNDTDGNLETVTSA